MDSDLEIVSSRLLDWPSRAIFEAFADPVRLARWWGPRGFRSTFQVFELWAGGEWRFVMHGPDGTDHRNEARFVEVIPPDRIVLEHRSRPKFVLTITLAGEQGRTRLTWVQRFESAEICAQVRTFAVAANEENFDRLEAELARQE